MRCVTKVGDGRIETKTKNWKEYGGVNLRYLVLLCNHRIVRQELGFVSLRLVQNKNIDRSPANIPLLPYDVRYFHTNEYDTEAR